MSKNLVRTELRNDLMSFSKVVNRIDTINEYLCDYQRERKNKGKLCNSVDLSYSFLNFARTKVYVFGGLLLDKKSFSDDTMFNLLCAITELPLQSFTQSVRSGKDWVKIESIGFEALMSTYDAHCVQVAQDAAIIQTIAQVAQDAAKVEETIVVVGTGETVTV